MATVHCRVGQSSGDRSGRGGRPESHGGHSVDEEGRWMLEWQVRWTDNKFSSFQSLGWKAQGKGC